MKFVLLSILLAGVVVVDSGHTFLGTNVQRQQVYHHLVEFGSKVFKKRVENLYFSMPSQLNTFGKTIQGIIVYDLMNSGASANITQGGIGYNFVNIRMKSERGRGLKYDVYIYA